MHPTAPSRADLAWQGLHLQHLKRHIQQALNSGSLPPPPGQYAGLLQIWLGCQWSKAISTSRPEGWLIQSSLGIFGEVCHFWHRWQDRWCWQIASLPLSCQYLCCNSAKSCSGPGCRSLSSYSWIGSLSTGWLESNTVVWCCTYCVRVKILSSPEQSSNSSKSRSSLGTRDNNLLAEGRPFSDWSAATSDGKLSIWAFLKRSQRQSVLRRLDWGKVKG